MYRGHTVAVVVPAYNEADHVGDVIRSLPSFVDRVYAVDDDSTDGTWDTLMEHGTIERFADLSAPLDRGPDDEFDVVPIGHFENRGAGGALKTGYRRALRDGADVTVAIDADGQMDPDQMHRLLDPIVDGAAGYAKGDRLATPESRAAMPPFRLLGNWILTGLTKVSSGYWGVRDPQNGYTAISREALAAVDLNAVPDDHDYTNDLLTRLNVAGVRVADVEMDAVYGDESSTISYGGFIPRTSMTLLRSMGWRLYAQDRPVGSHPLILLYVIGVAIGAVGVGGGVWAAWWTLTGAGQPDAVGVMALMIVAGLVLLVAIGLDVGRTGTHEVIRR
ncbi:MAG: glycosyltransferase family 2 protein [Haloarculaceae archaeon]